MEKDTLLIRYLLLLRKWRFIAILSFLVAVLAGFLVAFLSSEVYLASATVLPHDRGAGRLDPFTSQVLSEFSSFTSGGLSPTASIDTALEILGSRRLARRVADRLNLAERLSLDVEDETERRVLAAAALQDRLEYAATTRGTVRLSATAETPEFAVEIAESVVEGLGAISSDLKTAAAHRTRVFLEERREEVLKSLSEAESRLVEFQSEHGMIAPEQQSEALIQLIAQLKAKKLEKEAMLEAKLLFLNRDHPEIRQVQAEIRGLATRLKSLMGGNPSPKDRNSEIQGTEVPMSDVPALSTRLGRLMLDVEIYAGLLQMLTQQLEAAKIDEVRDIPMISVLDPPTKPLYRDWPKRKLIVTVSAFVGLLIGCLAPVFVDQVSQMVSGIRS
ncbi:MAG: hypothetical protein GF355_14335 [Candidatus Eisenbacteria bacterium]|nr:hypothetical protein [Candidatus Eisenbacteria bacterium]